jgi:hypothetical protein
MNEPPCYVEGDCNWKKNDTSKTKQKDLSLIQHKTLTNSLNKNDTSEYLAASGHSIGNNTHQIRGDRKNLFTLLCKFLEELIKIAYDMSIRCFQLIFINSYR